MKILVGVKHAPDTEAKVKIAPDGVSIDETGVKMVISAYDEFALEEALKIRDAAGEGEVVAVTAAKESGQSSLRQALAMGADRAVLVKDDRFDHADGLARAHALAQVAKTESPDLVLLGKYGVGTDENQTGPMLGELLDMPHVGAVIKLELEAGKFTVRREIEGAAEILEGTLPAVLTIDKGINEPRYPSLKGIMAAKKKPLEMKTPEELGLDTAELGEGARVTWESLELLPPREAGRILEGEVDDVVRELVRVLREEAKVL